MTTTKMKCLKCSGRCDGTLIKPYMELCPSCFDDFVDQFEEKLSSITHKEAFERFIGREVKIPSKAYRVIDYKAIYGLSWDELSFKLRRKKSYVYLLHRHGKLKQRLENIEIDQLCEQSKI